VIRLTNQLTK